MGEHPLTILFCRRRVVESTKNEESGHFSIVASPPFAAWLLTNRQVMHFPTSGKQNVSVLFYFGKKKQ